jgi:hypothetical protein
MSSKARAFCALSIVSVSFLYPVLDGLLGRLKLLGEARGCSSVSGEFDDSVSEFVRPVSERLCLKFRDGS